MSQILGSYPDCIPLLSFSNSLLMPGNNIQVKLDGFQGFALAGEVAKNGGYVGIVKTLDDLGGEDFFTTGTLASLSIVDLSPQTTTVNLQGIMRFDIHEYVKTPQNFYSACVRYKDNVQKKAAKSQDRSFFLDKLDGLLTSLENAQAEGLPFLDVLQEDTHVEDLSNLMTSEFYKKQFFEPTSLESAAQGLCQYIEDTMFGPLVGFTRH